MVGGRRRSLLSQSLWPQATVGSSRWPVPSASRLTAWLDHRARTWPASINPHLFVTRRSAPRLIPVGPQFPWQKTYVKPRALREDRILHEIHAMGGDIRRICDLFDLKVDTAMRYAATLGHPDPAGSRDLSS